MQAARSWPITADRPDVAGIEETPGLLRGFLHGHDLCDRGRFVRDTELCDLKAEPDAWALVDLDLANPEAFEFGLSPGHLDRLIQGNDLTGTPNQGHHLPCGIDYHIAIANGKRTGGMTMQVQLQEADEKTCVACSTINALRHFGMNASYDAVVDALTLNRKPKGGSYINLAAKYLRQDYPVLAVCSRPPHLITDSWGAALEAANRWERYLAEGYVGILGHKTTAGSAHAAVLHRITRDHGEPVLHCYDSAANANRGLRTYRAVNFVWWVDEDLSMTRWLELSPEDKEKFAIHPTGRVAYFVKPGPQPLDPAPTRSPFRARKPRRPQVAGES